MTLELQLQAAIHSVGKVGRVAAQNVVIELLMSQCVPLHIMALNVALSLNISSIRWNLLSVDHL